MQTNQSYSEQFMKELQTNPALKQKKETFWFILIGALIVLLAVSAYLFITNSKPNLEANLNNLNQKVTTLMSISNSQHKNLDSSSLRSANTNLQLALTGYKRDVQKYLKADQKAPTENLELKELETRLNDAKLNALLDRSFTTEVTYLIDQILNLTKEIYRVSDSETLTKVLEKNFNDLQLIKTQFEEVKL